MKKSFSSILTTVSLTLMMGSHAFAQSTAQNILSSIVHNEARVEAGKRLMINESTSARIYKDLDNANSSGHEITLPRGTEIEVLDISQDGKVAHIGIDSDVSSVSDLMVSVEDLQSRPMSEIEEVDGMDDEDMDVSDEGLFAGKKKRGGMTYCYRDVKTTLLKNKRCGRYASGVRAMEGYSILAKECGMKQVGKVKPASLPTYSVCVSGGGRPCGGGKACGHIAIKMPSGLWFGAGTRGTPYLPDSKKKGYQPRYVIGCLTPKGK